ncbi:hypothetical protein ACWGH2_16110 [Streptomyces sp. NPDC054871]
MSRARAAIASLLLAAAAVVGVGTVSPAAANESNRHAAEVVEQTPARVPPAAQLGDPGWG